MPDRPTLQRLAWALAITALLALGLSRVGVDAAVLAKAGVPAQWWSTLPPLVGIALAVATRRLVPSLALGVLVAAVLAGWPSTGDMAQRLVVTYVWEQAFDAFHLAVLVFTAALLGLVSVANRSGGTQGVVDAVMRLAKGVRGARVATYFMGLAVFFDDYANTAIVGPTVRPLFDRLRLSREKLAYLIDSTAAPVAGLAVISTWVGAEAGYLQEAAEAVGVHTSGYKLFFSALEYRFYCVFTLVFVFVNVWWGRDFGPMLTAERRALRTGQVLREGAVPLSGDAGAALPTDVAPRWAYAVAPIATVLGIIIASIWWLGGEGSALSREAWTQAFIAAANLAGGNALSYVFAAAALMGSVVAIGLPVRSGTLGLRAAGVAWWQGVRNMQVAFAILLLAWGLSQGCKDLGTAQFAAAALSGRVGAEWVPLLVFVVSGAVAFATGTSWGTMAILIPTAAHLGYQGGGEPVMLMAMAAVLDGAIFGDHCSPVSDTTVLSSLCSSCDHFDHVRTQIPYALAGAGVAGVAGYGLVAAYGVPTWVGYGVGVTLITLVLFTVGRRVDAAT